MFNEECQQYYYQQQPLVFSATTDHLQHPPQNNGYYYDRQQEPAPAATQSPTSSSTGFFSSSTTPMDANVVSTNATYYYQQHFDTQPTYYYCCYDTPNLTCTSTSPSPTTFFTCSSNDQQLTTGSMCLKQVPGQTWRLWEFLLQLLLDPQRYENAIHWTGNGWEFRLADPNYVALLWGRYKNKPRMNYDKLARSIRYYYEKNIITKLKPPTRYLYRFESGACFDQLFGAAMTPERLFALIGANPRPGTPII